MSLPIEPVTLSCAVCGDPCQLSEVEPDTWVHVDDRIYPLQGGRKKYDHEATFDLIEGRIID